MTNKLVAIASAQNVVYLYKTGIYTYGEALNRLASLGLPANEAASMLEL